MLSEKHFQGYPDRSVLSLETDSGCFQGNLKANNILNLTKMIECLQSTPKIKKKIAITRLKLPGKHPTLHELKLATPFKNIK